MNSIEPQYTKHAIWDRMQSFALSFFRDNNSELTDPMLRVILQGFAEEIYQLSADIAGIESRIADKLAEVLAPKLSVTAQPAHAILHARAIEGVLEVGKETCFALGKLRFYPVARTRVRAEDIRLMVINKRLYQVDSDTNKTMIARSSISGTSGKQSFWIGLETDSSDLNGISFYFDFPSMDDKEKYLDLLPYTRWNINGKQLTVHRGLKHINEVQGNKAVDLFMRTDLNTANRIDQNVVEYYRNRFLRIESELTVERSPFPEALKNEFTKGTVSGLRQELVWIEVECPLNLPLMALDAMRISVNAFPVANKRLVIRNASVGPTAPVIPLSTGENASLIAVHSIGDAMGREYYELPFQSATETEYRTYSLRRGGMEHFGKRQAREYLLRFADSVENRYALSGDNSGKQSKSKSGDSAIHELFRYIRTVADTYPRQVPETYILMDQIVDDTIFVKYWLTEGETANNIVAGTFIDTVYESGFDTASMRLLTPTIGGKQAPQAAEKDLASQHALVSRKFLVTHKDIAHYCATNFAHTVDSVKVVKGLRKVDYGLEETIDIYITPHKGLDKLLNDIDIAYFKNELEAISPTSFLYRIFIG